jgi:hypothetical protein
MWFVDTVSLVSNKAPIDAAQAGADAGTQICDHVGANICACFGTLPNSATNGAIIKKYHGYDGDNSSRTASNSILTSTSVVAAVRSRRKATRNASVSKSAAARTA